MNDDQQLLANAYLDGQLTAAERADAEVDPEVMAEVEALRGLQAQLRDVGPPTDEARERALIAALGAFDAVNGGAEVTAATRAPAPPPVRARPAYTRYLGVAAATLAVGLLGVVVVTSGGGGDTDDAADVALDASDAPATAALSADAADPAGDDGERALVESAPIDEEATRSTALDDADDAEESLEVAAAEAELDEAADEAGDAAGAVTAAPPVYEPGMRLATPIDLLAYGLHLLEQRDLQTLPPTPNSRCAFPDVDAHTVEILDETVIVVEGEERLLLIAVDTESGATFALDPDTCGITVESPTP